MAEYIYPKDGKLHTRWSELVRCTPGQIERVVAERMGHKRPFQNEHMAFGIVRHNRLAREVKKLGKIPPRFNLDLEVNPINAEREVAVEMFPGVVIHSTPDIFDNEWIADFKTIILDDKKEENKHYLDNLEDIPNARRYKASKQTAFYAWMLSVYGYQIKDLYYLCEVWNHNRTKILGYLKPKHKELDPEIFNELRDWTLGRVHLLKEVLRTYQKVEV